MRKFSISLTVALVLVALLWGNCLSCPEMLAPHSCCHKPQPASAACHTQNLQNFEKAEKTAPTAPIVAVIADLPALNAPPQLSIFRPIVSQLTPLDTSTPPGNLRV